jgi:hypothetical protein
VYWEIGAVLLENISLAGCSSAQRPKTKERDKKKVIMEQGIWREGNQQKQTKRA